MNEFKTQVDMLGRIRHRHLVSVLGHCTEEMSTTITAGDGTEEQKSYCLFIVSEFVEHGDLRSHVGSKFPSSTITLFLAVRSCTCLCSLCHENTMHHTVHLRKASPHLFMRVTLMTASNSLYAAWQEKIEKSLPSPKINIPKPTREFWPPVLRLTCILFRNTTTSTTSGIFTSIW